MIEKTEVKFFAVWTKPQRGKASNRPIRRTFPTRDEAVKVAEQMAHKHGTPFFVAEFTEKVKLTRNHSKSDPA